MKNTTRKLLVALLLVFTMLMSLATVSAFADDASTKTFYFSNNKGWSTVNVHYWGGASESSWPGVAATKIGTNGYGEDIYAASIPADSTSIIFNDGSSQTVDIDLGTIVDNAFYLTETDTEGKWNVGTWNYTDESGSTTTPPADNPPANDPVSYSSYTVAGTAGLCGSEWNTEDTNNDLTLGENGVYSKTFTAVPAGEHKFKVAADHTWDVAWPGSDYAFTLTESCDVTITFDPQTQKVSVIAEKLGETTAPSDGLYTVAGQSALCGSDWSTTDTFNDMTLNPETGLYEKTFTGIPAGDYECKVVMNHSWDTAWGGNSGDYGNYGFSLDGEYNVTITFDPATSTVGHVLSESTGATERPTPEGPDIDTSETITLYLSNSKNWENPMVYYWTLGASDQNAAWPGQAMEWDGEKMAYYVVVPKYYVNIIFNDGNGTQTADLTIPGDNYIFDNTTNEWTDMKDYVPPREPENTTVDITVYVKDTANWGDVWVYYWDMNGLEAAVWPGVAMELVDGYYTYTIPAGNWAVIFNNGGSWEDGSLIQTGDLIIPTDGKVYLDNGNNLLYNDSAADDGNAWYKLGEATPDSGNQGDNTKPDVPKGELTFLQKIAKALLLWLRSMEEMFLNMFPAAKK